MSTEDFFVALVEQNRMLWDKTNKDYKNSALKEKIWTDIGTKCNISSAEAANLFFSIRLKYVRRKHELKVLGKNGSGAKMMRPWSLHEQLRFLDKTITPRRTLSSIIQKSSEQHQQYVIEKLSCKQEVKQDDYSYSVDPLAGTSSEIEDYAMVSEESLPLMSPTLLSDGFSRSSTPVSKTTIIKPVQKRKRQDDALERIADAISAPVDFGADTDIWSVSEEVKNFCKFIGNRLNEMPKEKLRTAEMKIMKTLTDVENE